METHDLGIRLDPRLAHRATRISLAAFTLCLVSLDLNAQRVYDEVISPNTGDSFGASLANIGDLNGDGFDEILVGAPDQILIGQGHAYVLSGSDRSIVYSLPGNHVGDRFGFAVDGAGDVNHDGTPDFVVGANRDRSNGPQTGLAVVYSGADGSTLHTFTQNQEFAGFGSTVSGVGDVNNDGYDDVAVGAPSWKTGITAVGRIWVWSGFDGSLIHSTEGAISGRQYGSQIRPMGDVDLDGFDDYAVNSWGSGHHGDPGQVSVISGALGTPLHVVVAPVNSNRYSRGLDVLDDLTGDGIPELLIYAFEDGGALPLPPPISYVDYPSTLAAVDPTTGIAVYRVVSPAATPRFSSFIRTIGDIDGDGFVDWTATFTGDDAVIGGGAIRVHSGFDGRLLFRIDGEHEYETMLYSCGAGDNDGDGRDEFVLGSSGFSQAALQPIDTRVRFFTTRVLQQNYTDLCTGDGGDQLGCTDCPCGNNAPPQTVGGCLNSNGRSAQLLPGGSPSVSLPVNSLDDLRFALRWSYPNSVSLLRAGYAVSPANLAHPCYGKDSGSRNVFLDGLKCIGRGRTVHGARHSDTNGRIGFGNPPWGGEGGPPAGLAQARGFSAGQIRYFQAWYRDDPNLGCGRGFNTSQAVVVIFEP